jgi:hypothetical protein
MARSGKVLPVTDLDLLGGERRLRFVSKAGGSQRRGQNWTD